MESYRIKIINRRNHSIQLAILVGVIMILLLANRMFNIFYDSTPKTVLQGAVSGFRIGLFLTVEFKLIKLAMRYTKLYKDADKLKEKYIIEHDERNNFITQEVTKICDTIIYISLSISTIIASFFNFAVFVTLFSVLMFLCTIQYIATVHIEKKY